MPRAAIHRPRNADATRARILQAARGEFARRDFRHTRIEDIAARAGTNRRMIYYYFRSKEGLYLAALESVYADLIALERAIDVEHLGPVAAIAAIINLKIDHYARNPHFITFLTMENLYKAKHLRKSRRLVEFKAPLTQILSRVLARGQEQGVFRSGIDPVDLYISICALGYMYFSNQHTLGVIFGRKLTTPVALVRRKRTIIDLVTSYLRRDGTSPGTRTARRALLQPLAQ